MVGASCPIPQGWPWWSVVRVGRHSSSASAVDDAAKAVGRSNNGGSTSGRKPSSKKNDDPARGIDKGEEADTDAEGKQGSRAS